MNEELQVIYNQIIEELAKDAIDRKPVNRNLLEIIANIQRSMRDNDIIEAMNRIRQNNRDYMLDGAEVTAEYLEPMSIPREKVYLSPRPIPGEEINIKIMKKDKLPIEAAEKVYKKQNRFGR